mgnify:CR=1 FL=1
MLFLKCQWFIRECKVGAESKRLINELRKLDVHFTFASGRLHSSLKEYAEELNIRSPIISLNGALIKNDVTVYQTYFPNSYIKRAIKLSDNYVTNIALCHSDNIYYTEQNLLVPEVLDFFGSSFEMVPSYTPYYSNTLEIVIIGDNKGKLHFIDKKNGDIIKTIKLSTHSISKIIGQHNNNNIYLILNNKKLVYINLTYLLNT